LRVARAPHCAGRPLVGREQLIHEDHVHHAAPAERPRARMISVAHRACDCSGFRIAGGSALA
jgi:hypothetical protein